MLQLLRYIAVTSTAAATTAAATAATQAGDGDDADDGDDTDVISVLNACMGVLVTAARADARLFMRRVHRCSKASSSTVRCFFYH
jgi:hypothetical protein